MRGKLLKCSILLALLFCLFGCTTSKKLTEKKTKSETKRDIKETETKTTYRQGDTLTINVPNIRYKDTTIIKYNYETKTQVRVRYDDQGNQHIDCISAEMKQLIQTVRDITEEKKEDIKERNKEKESVINPTLLLYIFLGLGALMIVNKIMNKFI